MFTMTAPHLISRRLSRGALLLLLLLFLFLRVQCNTITDPSSSADAPVFFRQPKNSTAMVGEAHSFYCEADGVPRPKLRWYKDGRKMAKTGSGYRMRKQREVLEFDRLRISDAGIYVCAAKNKNGDVRSAPAILNIQTPVYIPESNQERSVYYGSEVTLLCNAIGNPPPQIKWMKNSKPIIDEKTERVYQKKNLTINATASAEYTCEAENFHTNGVSRENKTIKITVIYKETQSERSKGYCKPYNGTICGSVLRGGRLVFYNNSHPDPPAAQEELVERLLGEMMSTAAPDDAELLACQGLALEMLCHWAMPECQDGGGEQDGGRVVVEGAEGKGEEGTEKMEKVGVEKIEEVEGGQQVRENNGSEEEAEGRGTKNVTFEEAENEKEKTEQSTEKLDGKKTKREIVPKPKERCRDNCFIANNLHCLQKLTRASSIHAETKEIFIYLSSPELTICETNSSNPCTALGEEPPQVVTYSIVEPEEVRQMEHIHFDFVIIVSLAIIISTVLVVLIIFLLKRMNVSPFSKSSYHATPQWEFDISKLQTNECYHQQQPANTTNPTNTTTNTTITCPNPALEYLEYPRNDIVYLRDIGLGAFGRVFQAKVPCKDKSGSWEVVAVKMLREDTPSEMLRDFEREASLMAKFCHPNIVKLIGVCAVGKPMCLVFEYMSKGDLNQFLRACSPEHFIVRQRSNTARTVVPPPKISHIEQLDISIQVSSGMKYLSEKGYIHRDLATRNCLVGEKLVVKISDFGLTRCYSEMQNHSFQTEEAIPIRWMPMESILHNEFTTKSDVWSFGVLLWEIFSFALQPYYGMTHDEVIRYIQEGNTLATPENTPDALFSVMQLCWSRNPQSRPSFLSLQTTLRAVRESLVKSSSHTRLSSSSNKHS